MASHFYFRFRDFAQLGRSKSTCRPNFGDMSQSTAEILLLRVSENTHPPCWSSTSGFDFHVYITIGLSFCICLPSFVQIGPSVTEIWRHIHYPRWRPSHRNSASGFVFRYSVHLGMSISTCTPNFGEIPQSMAEILLLPVSKNKRPPCCNSTSSFNFHVCVTIGLSFCICIPNFVQTEHAWQSYGVISIIQDGGHGIAILLPVFVCRYSAHLGRSKATIKPNFGEYLNPRLSYYYFRFLKTNVRHVGILVLVLIFTFALRSACHSASTCQILSTLDHPRQSCD